MENKAGIGKTFVKSSIIIIVACLIFFGYNLFRYSREMTLIQAIIMDGNYSLLILGMGCFIALCFKMPLIQIVAIWLFSIFSIAVDGLEADSMIIMIVALFLSIDYGFFKTAIYKKIIIATLVNFGVVLVVMLFRYSALGQVFPFYIVFPAFIFCAIVEALVFYFLRDIIKKQEEGRLASRRNVQDQVGAYVHTMRNLLQAPKTFFSLPTDQQKDFQETAKTAIEQIEKFITYFYFTSRQNGKRPKPEPAIHRISDVIKQASQLTIDRKAEEKRFFEVDSKIMAVFDGNIALDIFVNLLRNAQQALQGREGKKEIRIKSEVTDGNLDIIISDTGPGMDAKKIKNVWKPGYTDKPGGFGMGLYSVMEGVKDNGWEIDLYSKPGEGAIFKIKVAKWSYNSQVKG